MHVRLTANEMAVISQVADRVNRKPNDFRGEIRAEGRWLGFCAERAVANWLGVDYMPAFHRGGDANGEFSYEGISIEVKWAKWEPPHFKVYPESRQFGASVGFLVTGQPPSMDIRGWITREVFDRVKEVRNYSYGPRETVVLDQMAYPEAFLKVWPLLEGVT